MAQTARVVEGNQSAVNSTSSSISPDKASKVFNETCIKDTRCRQSQKTAWYSQAVRWALDVYDEHLVVRITRSDGFEGGLDGLTKSPIQGLKAFRGGLLKRLPRRMSQEGSGVKRGLNGPQSLKSSRGP